MNDLQDEIVDLQIRLAYQEDTIAQLNLVVTKQDAAIIQLQQQMRIYARKLEELSYTPASEAGDEESDRPPHY